MSAVVKMVLARPSHVFVIRPTSVPLGSWIEKFQARQFSALIAPSGQILRWLTLYHRDVMSELLPLREGSTLYSRFGEWLAYLAFAVGATALAACARARRA